MLILAQLRLFCSFLQDESTGEITFYMKGADVVMAGIVQYNDWLEEEVRGCLSCVQRVSPATAFLLPGQRMTKLVHVAEWT